jgi:nickel-dependent lactate racemase
MRVHLQYGIEGIDAEIPCSDVTVLAPQFTAGLPDEESAFHSAVRQPLRCCPLRDTVRPGERVAIVVPDITRPLPTARILPWVLSELAHVPKEKVTIISGTGSHRQNSPEEMAVLAGEGVLSGFRVVNHSAYEPARLAVAGKTSEGRTIFLNREYVEADRRVVLGFIEPHFMAGFSGGYKGIFPALADIDSIMYFHRASVIADPASTWGMMEGNPTQDQIRENGSLLPVDFCINVTLNRKRRITRFFCGQVASAHSSGCDFARSACMVACDHAYPIVVTTNGGYPLDQNLYQAVKGMSAAAQIVQQGGFILAASRCDDGFPAHGNFRKLLFEHDSPKAILDTILAPGFSMYDQWEAQMLAMILLRARVGLFSELDSGAVRRAHLEPVDDIGARITVEIERFGDDVPIAVLPEGPMTIPYLAPSMSQRIAKW